MRPVTVVREKASFYDQKSVVVRGRILMGGGPPESYSSPAPAGVYFGATPPKARRQAAEVFTLFV